jgi:hypothetical protein
MFMHRKITVYGQNSMSQVHVKDKFSPMSEHHAMVVYLMCGDGGEWSVSYSSGILERSVTGLNLEIAL